MIRVTDLSAGDRVMVACGPGKGLAGRVGRIVPDGRGGAEISLTVENGDGTFTFSRLTEKELMPVPLTEDMLRRVFGEDMPAGCRAAVSLTCGNAVLSCGIRHVHELQHLLRIMKCGTEGTL